MKKIAIILLFFLLYFLPDASAANKYWYGNNSTDFSVAANWSTSNTSYVASGSIPGSADVAYFGNYSGMTNANCVLSAAINISGMQMVSGYTGTFTQGTYNITIGSGGATLSAGTFTGGSGSITVSGVFTISGTAFTSTSGTFSTSASFTKSSGSFIHNNGTLKFTATNTITGSDTLYKLEFAPSATATYTIASGTTLTVQNTLTISGTNSATINTGNINAEGDVTVTNSGTSGGGSYTLTLSGTNNQTVTAPSTQGQGRFANVVINKSGGTLSLSGLLTVNGNWTYTAGTISAGTSTVLFTGGKTVSGTHTLANVTFAGGGTFVISNTLTVTGTLTNQGSFSNIFNTGTIDAQGDITVTNTATGGGGDATIKITGTAGQTLTGSGTAGQGRLPKIEIDKTGGTLDLKSVISVANHWTYKQGTVLPNNSSVSLYGTINLDGQEDGASGIMPFYNLGIASGTITLIGNIDANNNLTVATGTTLSASSKTIKVGGVFTNNGTFTYSTSTVVFDGASTVQQITGTSGTTVNFYNVTFSKTGENYLSLSRPVKINNALTLTSGRIITSSTNYLEVAHGATCSGGGVGAYVHGPMRKTGNAAFSFPLGDTSLTDSAAYHPLAITAPSATTDQFEARYYATGQTVGDSLVDSLASVSAEEYWTLERKAGTANVYVTVGWNRNSDINNIGSLRLAGWNGAKWLDYGQADLSINWPTGVVGSSIAISFPSNPIYISIGTSRPTYYGHARLKRKLDGGYYETKGKSLYFSFEDEYNDQNHHLIYKVYDEANSNVAPTLVYNSNNDPLSYYGDNRFKLDLYTSSGALHNGYYILEVTNEKDEKFYLRFHIN